MHAPDVLDKHLNEVYFFAYGGGYSRSKLDSMWAGTIHVFLQGHMDILWLGGAQVDELLTAGNSVQCEPEQVAQKAAREFLDSHQADDADQKVAKQRVTVANECVTSDVEASPS